MVCFFVRYIILYGVVGGGNCEFDADTRVDIFLLSSAFFADSLTRNMRCAATMFVLAVCFSGRRGRRPLQ